MKRKLIAQRAEFDDDDDDLELSDEDEDVDATDEVLESGSDTETSSPESRPATATTTAATSSKFINKQRTLIIASRGISHRDRHLLADLRDLLPHSKKDSKFDGKDQLIVLNEAAEMKNCNNCMYFEARKHQDLYMWLSRCPQGPSVKFLVQNIHTMEEMKLTGNCLKGSRPIMSFDKAFDSEPHFKLLKEMILQIFGSPKNHPKSKPFIDHVFSWFIVDGRIWFRNYQVVYDDATKEKNAGEPVLVEIGPRLVLNPIKIFSGSFHGATLFENPEFVSPNLIRSNLKKQKSLKYANKTESKDWHKQKVQESILPVDEVAQVFKERK